MMTMMMMIAIMLSTGLITGPGLSVVGWSMVATLMSVAGRSRRLSGPTSERASSASMWAIQASSSPHASRTCLPADGRGQGCRGRRGRSPRCLAVMRSWEPPRRAALARQNTMRESRGRTRNYFFPRSIRAGGRTYAVDRHPEPAPCVRPVASRRWSSRRRARRPPARRSGPAGKAGAAAAAPWACGSPCSIAAKSYVTSATPSSYTPAENGRVPKTGHRPPTRHQTLPFPSPKNASFEQDQNSLDYR